MTGKNIVELLRATAKQIGFQQLGFYHTRLVPIPYVQGVPWPSIRTMSQIALSKSLGDGGRTPSWFICREKWLYSQKESPRWWRRCHGSHIRCQPRVQFNFIPLLIQKKSSLPGTNPTSHTPHPFTHTCLCQAFNIVCHFPTFLYDTYQLSSVSSPLHNVPRILCHLFIYSLSKFLLGYLLLCHVGSIFGGQRYLSYPFLPFLPISNNVVSLNRKHSWPLVVSVYWRYLLGTPTQVRVLRMQAKRK